MISAGRGFVLVGKFTEGIFPPCEKEFGNIICTLQKNMGGIMSTYTKTGRQGGGGGVGGGVRSGGILFGYQYGYNAVMPCLPNFCPKIPSFPTH